MLNQSFVSVLNSSINHCLAESQWFVIGFTHVDFNLKQRDTVGIGGSWSEFLDYTVASMKSDNVKLLLGDNSVSNGKITSHYVS